MNKNILTVALVIVALIVGAVIGAAGAGGGSTTRTVTSTVTGQVGAGSTQQAVTSTVTVTSLRAGAALVNYSGSGNGNSQPFTASTSTVSIVVKVTVTSSNPSLGHLSWFIYPTASTAGYVATGSVNGQSGPSTFTGYNLAPGTTYYVMVLSANANWQIVVQPMS